MTRFPLCLLLVSALVPSPCRAAPTTIRASVASDGSQGNDHAGLTHRSISISADGRHVAFASKANNLVTGDTNGEWDVFVRDTVAGTTALVSASSDGTHGNDRSGYDGVSISADGRYVAFASNASNLVAGDTNDKSDVFVRDTQAGTTTLVSVSSDGSPGIWFSAYPSISADGRHVAFASLASNLVAWDINRRMDVFVRDTVAGTTRCVSVASDGSQGNDDSGTASDSISISADGRYVAFQSRASNLVPGDTNGTHDIFVRDTVTETTTRVSISSEGSQANLGSISPAISADGRYVTFATDATNLETGDSNAEWDVFVRDTVAGTTRRVSVPSNGLTEGFAELDASISANGRYVAFTSHAFIVTEDDVIGDWDVFVRDMVAGITRRVSVSTNGIPSNGSSYNPVLSADGRYVAFVSPSSNLVAGDTNGTLDVFVHGPLFGVYPFGDVNGDMSSNVADVALLLRIAGGIDTGDAGHVARGDIEADGRVDLRDAVALLRHLQSP